LGFFSGDYLSACDLSTALGRLIPAVLRGDVKPGTARTVAYLAQTLLQTIHISEQEYINAFGTVFAETLSGAGASFFLGVVEAEMGIFAGARGAATAAIRKRKHTHRRY